MVDPVLVDRVRIASLLEATGHTPVQEETARGALARLRAEGPGSYQLVVTELNLPDGGGVRWVETLSAGPEGAGLPVLVVTPQPSRETTIAIVQAGAENLVAKPFASEVLLRRVTEILAGRRPFEQARPGQVSWTLSDYLERELRRAGRSGLPVSIVVARAPAPDADPAPDLRAVLARHLRVRETDLVFTLETGEVAILLPDTDRAGAQVVESRIERALGERVRTASATAPQDGAEAAALLRSALARLEERAG